MLDPRSGTPETPVDNATTGQFLWTREANRNGWAAMRGTESIAPERLGHFGPALVDNVDGLPPTLIAIGSVDLFLEECVAYAMRLSRAGVAVELYVYPGGVHGFEALQGANTDAYWLAVRNGSQTLAGAGLGG